MADKEEGFGLVPKEVSSEKSVEAIHKNFKVVNQVPLRKVKQRVFQLCQKLLLDKP